jgi:predicted amidophosphoribosyltransferase
MSIPVAIRRAFRMSLACLVGGRCPGCRGRSVRQPCAGCRVELWAIPSEPHAALREEGVAARLIRRAKHGQWRGAADELAPLVLDRLGGAAALAARIDLVTWVPADPGRRRQRGGHFPEQLARRVARECGRPAVCLLVRDHSRAQRGLDEHERITNVRGMFRVRRPGRGTGATRHGHAPVVLLLDDVCTTGATLDEASDVLADAWYRVEPYAVVGVPRRFA